MPLMLMAFLVVTVFNVVRMIRKRELRKVCVVRLTIWIAALVLVFAMVIHWDERSRTEANVAVKAILAQKARTGSFPASLGAIGLDEGALHDRLGIRYFFREGHPVLAYQSSVMPLTTYDYDFESGKWVENPY